MPLPLADKRILFVVEDEDLAGLLCDAAARLGAEPSLHRSGQTALDGLSALAPHSAVLDLPLADLRSSDAIGALKRAGVPVVAISGSFRGPRAASEVLRAGASDFFEKPFQVLGLMGRLSRLMGLALPGLETPEDEVTGSIPLPRAAVAPPGSLDDAPFLDLTDEDEVHDPPPGPPPAPASTSGTLPPLPSGERARAEGPPARRGDLSRVSVPRLLVTLHVGQATGALTLQRGAVKKILVVEKGAPVYAASNVAGERLGAIAVRRGVVSSDDLAALRLQAAEARTSDLLLRAGKLTPARRAELVSAQVRAIAWSTLEWRDGRYDFQLARPPPGILALGLSMADLLLEGMVRASTLERLRAELPLDLHLAPSPTPAFELYALGLRPGEAHLLSLCDGTKSVRDLVALARLPEREALAFLQSLRVMRVVDDVERVLAGTRRIGYL